MATFVFGTHSVTETATTEVTDGSQLIHSWRSALAKLTANHCPAVLEGVPIWP